MTCAVTGPVAVVGDLGGAEGAEVFAEGKNLFQTKTLRVRRVFDKKNNAVAYVAYSTRIGSTPDGDTTSGASRYRTSLCAVALPSPRAAEESPELAE